jgi:hypothetical protein
LVLFHAASRDYDKVRFYRGFGVWQSHSVLPEQRFQVFSFRISVSGVQLMNDNVVKGQFGAQARRKKHSRSSLCSNGHHRWEPENSTPFDVKRGELVTRERCSRCGKTRVLTR